MLLYVWKKQNNDLVFRYKIDYIPLEQIGDVNSYGWILQSIQVIYNNKFCDYGCREKIREKLRKKVKRKKMFLKFLKENWFDILLFILLISFMVTLILLRGV